MWRHLQRQGDRGWAQRETERGGDAQSIPQEAERDVGARAREQRGRDQIPDLCSQRWGWGGPDKSLPFSEPQFYSLLKWC